MRVGLGFPLYRCLYRLVNTYMVPSFTGLSVVRIWGVDKPFFIIGILVKNLLRLITTSTETRWS